MNKLENSLENDDCSICLNNMHKDIIKISCNHIFHIECIFQSMIFELTSFKKISCPLCRANIKKNELINIIKYHIHKIYNKFIVKYGQILYKYKLRLSDKRKLFQILIYKMNNEHELYKVTSYNNFNIHFIFISYKNLMRFKFKI